MNKILAKNEKQMPNILLNLEKILPFPRILIIDDDVDLCQEISDILKEKDFEVVYAGNSKQAKQILIKDDIDIILLDLKLPDGNGLDLLEEIKKVKSDVQVIVITAYGSLSSAVKAIREDFFDYITKPFDPDKLLKVINKAAVKQSTERKEREDMAIKEQFQKLAIGRELKMIKLKNEITTLKKDLKDKERILQRMNKK